MSYPHIGVPDAFHPLSHHADNKASLREAGASCSAITARCSPGFLAKLAQMPDGDAGSMLDNSIFLYGSNMSNSNKHDSFPLPTLVFGDGGGDQGQPAPALPGSHADRQPAVHDDAARRRSRRRSRRQHRRARRRSEHEREHALELATLLATAGLAAASAPACAADLVDAAQRERRERRDRRARERRRREYALGGRHDGAALGRAQRQRSTS